MRGARSGTLRFMVWLGCTGLAFLLGALAPSPALACSPIEPPQPVTASDNPSDDVPPVLKTAQLDVRRAKEPGSSGDGDCGWMGGYTFLVDAADDVTPPEGLAYSLRLVKGKLPFALPDQPVRATSGRSAGEMSSWFSDDGEAFDAVVAVAMVDEAGNVSEPLEVHASGDAVGCGCALSAGSPGTAAAALAVGALLFVRRSRRFASSSRRHR